MKKNHELAQNDCEKALELVNANNIRRAGPVCEALIARYPDFAPARAVFAELWSRVGQFDQALNCITLALELSPASLQYQVDRARFEALAGQHRQALEHAKELVDQVGERFALLDTLGNVFSRVGDQSTALEVFERAVALEPEHPTALYNLATSYRFFGRLDEAEALLDRVLSIDPGDHEAVHSRSVLRTQTTDSNHVQELEARLGRASHWIAECRYAYALAKEYEDLGDARMAFEFYDRGARVMRAHRQSGVEAELARMKAARELAESGALGAGEVGNISDEPIFVVGLPRTGSTLIERMLGAHPSVFSAGELVQFTQEAVRVLGVNNLSEACQHLMGRPRTAPDWSGLGQAYLDATRPRTGHSAHFIDKMPANEYWASVINRALPDARFIWTSRDPMDTGYALFRTLFLTGHAWTYDLEDIGRYLRARSSTIKAIQQHLPARQWLEVRYEELVSSPEETVRRMLDFLGLEWHDACLRPEGGQGAIVTASSHQARQAVYTSSIGKWRQLEDELQPLARALRR